ncbi:penicillin-binding protein [Hydrotalea sp.]|uniref:penicillin-binding protein n=1 Tax=Hydrotalea sp. TaxID=2881279 RepID=UPI002632B30B|nr:penicillin-binding protein [Hydrotalea sp.]
MDVKRDILWRVYLTYILIVGVGIAIFAKAVYIQQVQGNYWQSLSDSLHERYVETDAERGTIYSEDGEMLSTSIPQFDIYVDFDADGLREKNGKRFRENIDSLSISLANLFKDETAAGYKRILLKEYRKKFRYYLLKRSITYQQYTALKSFPLVRLGKNKSGFITDDKSIRLNPYKMLAFRTIGLDRDSFKVGLELSYDSILRGKSGTRLVRYIAGGVGVPVDGGYETEAINGKDVITNIDVLIQEITENALMKMLVQNDAQHGCAIVMETATGKIKAMANLGKGQDGNYYENYNYAINASEPGSTFKLATLMALLEDKKITLNQTVNLQGGTLKIADRTVYDAEQHGHFEVTAKQAFELSSNVGMAKMALDAYKNNPKAFIKKLHDFRLDEITGIDLVGEKNSTIIIPGSKNWSATTLPWMAFGYNVEVTPLQTLTLYNAIGNNGMMMKPYLVNAIVEEGKVLKKIEPTVLIDKVCSNTTLKQVQSSLEGVCTNGTAKELFKNTPYTVAGKTGTALVADGNKGYSDKVYQSSFAGYFPANHPEYTCIVVIKNKPFAKVFYGAAVAGVVFKEIADRLYTLCVKESNTRFAVTKNDSTHFNYVGYKNDLLRIAKSLNIKTTDSVSVIDDWAGIAGTRGNAILYSKKNQPYRMPSLKGMGLKDVMYLCGNMGLKVNAKGVGKVSEQSIMPGEAISKGQTLTVALN